MTINPAEAADFLAHHRIAVIGASDDPRNFGRTIYRELRDRGYDVVAVNPHADEVLGDPCYAGVAEVPGVLDAAIVMVPAGAAADVVLECGIVGIRRVWLFKGLGGRGSVSDEAVALAHRFRMEVVEGACPLMFLEPVGRVHRLHRAIRRVRGAFGKEPVRAGAA